MPTYYLSSALTRKRSIHMIQPSTVPMPANVNELFASTSSTVSKHVQVKYAKMQHPHPPTYPPSLPLTDP